MTTPVVHRQSRRLRADSGPRLLPPATRNAARCRGRHRRHDDGASRLRSPPCSSSPPDWKWYDRGATTGRHRAEHLPKQAHDRNRTSLVGLRRRTHPLMTSLPTTDGRTSADDVLKRQEQSIVSRRRRATAVHETDQKPYKDAMLTTAIAGGRSVHARRLRPPRLPLRGRASPRAGAAVLAPALIDHPRLQSQRAARHPASAPALPCPAPSRAALRVDDLR